MTVETIIAELGFGLTLLSAVLAGVVWLVRLEGKAAANALATANVMTDLAEHKRQQAEMMAAHVAAREEARGDMIRVQEQLKHIQSLLERLLGQPKARRPRATDV
jgi:hypothetical protein